MFFCMFCSFSLLSLPFPDWCLIPYSRELIFPVLHLQIKFPGKPKPSLLFIIDKLTSANTHTTHTSASSYCIKPITNIRTSTTTVVMKGNPLSKKEMELISIVSQPPCWLGPWAGGRVSSGSCCPLEISIIRLS